MKLTSALILPLFGLALALGGVTAWQASQSVTYGSTVAELEHQRAELLQTRQQLSHQLAEQQTLQTVRELAQQQGFQELGQPQALKDQHTVASLQ
jgi:hypothetical protein